MAEIPAACVYALLVSNTNTGCLSSRVSEITTQKMLI